MDRRHERLGEQSQTEVHAEGDDDHADERQEGGPLHAPNLLRGRLVEQLRELEGNDVVAALIAIWRYGAKNRPTSGP